MTLIYQCTILCQFNSIEYIFPNFVYLKKDGNEMGDSTWDSVSSLNLTTNE